MELCAPIENDFPAPLLHQLEPSGHGRFHPLTMASRLAGMLFGHAFDAYTAVSAISSWNIREAPRDESLRASSCGL